MIPNDELHRALTAIAAGELWEAHPGSRGTWWRLNPPHCRALVRPGDPEAGEPAGWLWCVKLAGSGRTFAGAAGTEHEALRTAERVIEEYRP